TKFDLEFRYPSPWTLVATGHKTEQLEEGIEQVSRWVSERPVPVVGFNLGRYSQNVTYAGKVPIRTYATSTVERNFPGTSPVPISNVPLFPPGRDNIAALAVPKVQPPSPSDNARIVGATSARAVEFYERYFGPYPYSELAITQLPGMAS